jgi:hypothetical protein
MQTVQVFVNDTDFRLYNLSGQVQFTDLVETIRREYARKSLRECHEIAALVGLSSMTEEEIATEIKAVRDAKTHS